MSQLPQTLDDWLHYITTLHSQAIDLGLTRIHQVALPLGLTQLSAQVILIAGTNGKGTTARFLEAYLMTQGHRVGVFSSPQLRHYTDQVRVNAGLLSDPLHCEAFAYIEQHRAAIPLTAFEFSTLAALKLLADQELDFVIIEVGMGGRLDSTNIVNPQISVITTIDLDHQAFLGNDRESIGLAKAGIFRANQLAIVGDLAIPASVFDYASQLNCPLICANRDYLMTENQQNWRWCSQELTLEPLIHGHIPSQNVATGLATLQQLQIPLSTEQVNTVLSSLVVEGRLQTLSDSPRIIVDVAHNPHAAAYLAHQLRQWQQQGFHSIHAIFGMLIDKDIEQVVRNVMADIDHWHLVDLTLARGAKAAQLADKLEKCQVQHYSCYDSVATALAEVKTVMSSDQDQLLIIFGSFHTVAQALAAHESSSKPL